jgi:hypothetical protein
LPVHAETELLLTTVTSYFRIRVHHRNHSCFTNLQIGDLYPAGER